MSKTVEIELDDLHELAAMNLKADDADMEEFIEEFTSTSLYQAYQQSQ